MPESVAAQVTPYRQAAEAYWDNGWRGLLPVRGKYPPPSGWTGWAGPDPSWPDVQAWLDGAEGGWNIALRMPAGVLGIDVDAYGAKVGAATLATREREWGPLPPTWITGSREDAVSGIRLYRVAPGLAWPGVAGPAIELVHRGHRYAMCWPSVHPDTGRTYTWRRPDQVVAVGQLPTPDELPLLPMGWVLGLCRGQHTTEAKADQTSAEAHAWLESLPDADKQPCRLLAWEGDQVQHGVSGLGGGSRHDAALAGVMVLCRMADEGHPGGQTVLAQVRDRFIASVGADRVDAAGEWGRIVSGAVARMRAEPAARLPKDPCWPPNPGGGGIRPAAALLSPDPAVRVGVPAVVRQLGATGAPGPATVPPSSPWWPQGLGAVLDGTAEDEKPVQLRRSDGVPLLYAGRINGILGPAESGKTWIALEAIRQCLAAGGRVVVLDFEDTPRGIVNRLRALGISDGAIRDGVYYASPDMPLQAGDATALDAALQEYGPALVVLDGVNAAMTVNGLDLIDNKDATTFFQTVLRRCAALGAAVLYIDHIPKNGDSAGGIGAQAKRAMTTGAALRVKVVEQFSRSHNGILEMTVDKDREGWVREHSQGADTVGLVFITTNGGAVQVRIDAVDAVPSFENAKATPLREKVADYIANAGEPRNQRQVESAVTGRKQDIVEALEWLVQQNYLARREGQFGAKLYTLIRLYNPGSKGPPEGPPNPPPGPPGH